MYDSLIDQNMEVTHDDPVDQEVHKTPDVNTDDEDTFLRRSEDLQTCDL